MRPADTGRPGDPVRPGDTVRPGSFGQPADPFRTTDPTRRGDAADWGDRGGSDDPSGALRPAERAERDLGWPDTDPAGTDFSTYAPQQTEPSGPTADDAALSKVPRTDFIPANEVEEALLAAAGEGSTDSFLSTLLLAKVLLPVPAVAPADALPGEEKFAWQTETIDGEPYVVVFTSRERLAERVDEPGQTVVVKFIQLIRAWPDPAWSFAVNPGTPVGATLPGGQIVALASWAAEVGLGVDSEDEAVQEPAAVEEVPAPTREPARDEHGQPPMMQKVVAPGHVAYYLERGYDRVSGFVHRVTEVAHLHSPEKLIAALGLRYPDSAFTPDTTEVYVLRWPAYRPSLYRIPYGGQNEAAMRAMEGWVIERPPFRGNGFAPGDSSEVVAEFKVDSARLPHGAQLWRVSTGDGEKLVAVLDSDQPVWRRVGED